MPGKLVHTNEILVMLGDNWFVERSAVQAAEIVDRRMEFVEENITKLKTQEEQLRSKSGLAPGLLGGQEYNEEGLPIVEITEPYFSDDEDQEGKPKKPALLPHSLKSPEEQARDRAILDRLEELEREEEERERRREAGEIVTSDEDTDSDDGPADDDDGASEDEFRPKGLDSDEEYEEAFQEYSDDEDYDLELEDEDATSSGRKSVRFADQVAKATRTKTKKNNSSSKAAPSAKPKSPSDLINQARAKQQAARSSTSDQIVTMDTLESTLAGMTTKSTTAEQEEEEPRPKTSPKSILKPSPKKTSLFKQMNAQLKSMQGASDPFISMPLETPKAKARVAQGPAAPRTISEFKKQREAAAGSSKSTPGVSKANVIVPPGSQTKAAGVYEVVERDVVSAPVSETIVAASSTAGAKDVIENTFTKPALESSESSNVGNRKKPSLFRQQQRQASETAAAASSTVGAKDVIENTFTKPVLASPEPEPSNVGSRKKPSLFRQQQRQASETTTTAPSTVGAKDVIENTFTKPAQESSEPSNVGNRKKPSLFRQQQRHNQTAPHMEPEPAVPGSSFQLEADDNNDAYSSRNTVPEVVSSRSIPSKKTTVVERTPSTKGKPVNDQNKSESPALRTIPVVASSKLRDTPLMKGVVIEHGETEPVDEDELEDDMLMRQVVSEYQERRQALIAERGTLNQEEIERLWEQQVIIPPGMIIPEHQTALEEYEDEEEDEDDVESDEDDEDEAQDAAAAPSSPPKKVSLFRASRLAGKLAKQ
ncbi:uri1, prefoldin-like chaperone [Mortierella sp. GBA43]|nr:uri1, prefoldin-like chaperone [Mortierella sp. GBA43]